MNIGRGTDCWGLPYAQEWETVVYSGAYRDRKDYGGPFSSSAGCGGGTWG